MQKSARHTTQPQNEMGEKWFNAKLKKINTPGVAREQKQKKNRKNTELYT